MTYHELSESYGKEVAARMWAVVSLEPKNKLVQSLFDFMGKKTLDQWAIALERIKDESTAG